MELRNQWNTCQQCGHNEHSFLLKHGCNNCDWDGVPILGIIWDDYAKEWVQEDYYYLGS